MFLKHSTFIVSISLLFYYFILIIYGNDFIKPWINRKEDIYIYRIIKSLFTFVITYIWTIYWCGKKRSKVHYLRFLSPLCFSLGSFFSIYINNLESLYYNEDYSFLNISWIEYYDSIISGIFFILFLFMFLYSYFINDIITKCYKNFELLSYVVNSLDSDDIKIWKRKIFIITLTIYYNIKYILLLRILIYFIIIIIITLYNNLNFINIIPIIFLYSFGIFTLFARKKPINSKNNNNTIFLKKINWFDFKELIFTNTLNKIIEKSINKLTPKPKEKKKKKKK